MNQQLPLQRSSLIHAVLGFALLGSFGCAPRCGSTLGELGNLGFELSSLSETLYEFESGDQLLAGARVCPSLYSVRGADGTHRTISTLEDEVAVWSCFAVQLLGAEADDEGCLHMPEAGEVLWSFEPTGACEWGGDHLRFTVVDAEPTLRLGFDDWRIRYGIDKPDAEVVGLAPGRSLAELREDPAAPRLVAAEALDVPLLRLDDAGGRVYWTRSQITLAHSGEGLTPVEPSDDPSDNPHGLDEVVEFYEYPLTLAPDTVARIEATLPDGSVLESPELIAVSAATAAASLDLVALLDDGAPYYAFAEVRDAEGRVIHGAPVEWSVLRGALPVLPGSLGNFARTAEYVWLEGDCARATKAPVERRAVLQARLGELEDSYEFVWIDDHNGSSPDPWCMYGEPYDEPEGESDDDDEPSGETGEGPGGATSVDGCGCTSEAPSAPTPWLLLLGGLGLLGWRSRRARRG
jgi:MYXO-CTERM domain-containing protein